jgi:cellulose synthase/poly-beta-1,6-N-acetylglucosamine synthase-like glycosyltransferase
MVPDTFLVVVFWVSAACVLYAYAGYAGVLLAVSRLCRRPVRRQAGHAQRVSMVMCAHNEQARIAGRVAELMALLRSTGCGGELIVVCDGSCDSTATEARRHGGDEVRVIELSRRQGKAAALSAGCAAAQNEILVFADCRQRWDANSLRNLLENFADPDVGAVSGDLVLESAPGVMAGVGLYWRYEKWLRKQESSIRSTVGVTGAICAVRRSSFPGVPSGTILDDVHWPMRVTMAGHRVIHDHRAIAFDRLPERAGDEFRRKVRTLAGNFQLVARLPQTLLPWRNPVWLQFVSHKLLRLAVPWAMIAMVVTSAMLPGDLYQTLLLAQIGFYLLAILGNIRVVGSQLRPAAAAASLVVLNAAAWMAFWVWITGRSGQSWSKVTYNTAVKA